MQDDDFEWDDDKAESNLAKHGVSFWTAREIFDDPLNASMPDDAHTDGEDRYLTIGNTFTERTIVVGHTTRDPRIRIIFARMATNTERRKFMNQKWDELHDEPQPEYDFTGAVRGMFYTGRKRTSVVVYIDEDVEKYFPTTKAVNDGLRILIAEGRVPELRNE